MVFRHAEAFEAEKILKLYQLAVGGKFCTWNEEYPGMEDILRDREAEDLFVLENDEGEWVGAVSIVPENEMDGLSCWKDGNAAEFARVVIAPEFQGRGMAKTLVEKVLHEIRRRGFSAVHIAVAAKNTPARKTYQKAGFTDRGEEDMYGNHYILCEKAL